MAFPHFAAAVVGLSASLPQTTSSLPQSTQVVSVCPPLPTTTGRGCCENGRPILTDPHTGQTVCSCQYAPTVPPLLGAFPRGLPPALESVITASAYAAAVANGYMGLSAEGNAFFNPLGSSAYDLKDSAEAWRSLAAHQSFPYDPMSLYPYGAGRKNATRENTNTLKAWLYEHRKNPYPTKGEKIMLAIITKMTLTQVSTWFANARRRLKKENKMTWSPRNRSEDGSEAGDLSCEVDVDCTTELSLEDDIDISRVSPNQELDDNGLGSSSRPSSSLSHTSDHSDNARGSNNDKNSIDRCRNRVPPMFSTFELHHRRSNCNGSHDNEIARDRILPLFVDTRKGLCRDRSPIQDIESHPETDHFTRNHGERRRATSSESCHAERQQVQKTFDENQSAYSRLPASTPSFTSNNTSNSLAKNNSSRPKIWSVAELLQTSSSKQKSTILTNSSSITSPLVTPTPSLDSSLSLKPELKAHHDTFNQSANGFMLDSNSLATQGVVIERSMYPCLQPTSEKLFLPRFNSGYLCLPETAAAAAAAWAATGGCFGTLGAYHLPFAHNSLTIPHTPIQASKNVSSTVLEMPSGPLSTAVPLNKSPCMKDSLKNPQAKSDKQRAVSQIQNQRHESMYAPGREFSVLRRVSVSVTVIPQTGPANNSM